MIERAGKINDLQVIGLFTIRLLVFLLAASGPFASAQESAPSQIPTPETTQSAKEPTSTSLWRYGAYLDLNSPIDFNFPENHQWRSKVTTQRVNEPNLNMALGYVRKEVNESSRWGMELALQTGRDVKGQIPNASLRYGDPYEQAETFRHFSRANVSYLAPVGTGLTLTAGLVNSTIGYESFYAKDNLNYTRSFIADYSPYFMGGAFAQYRFTESVKAAFGVINRYNFLSQPNNLPSYATQFKWTDMSHITFTQNLYYGPDQTDTALEFWRFFSDSILEWRREDLTVAFAYDIGTEKAIPQAGGQRSLWTGGAIFSQWRFARNWAVGLRPELYYDPSGTMTGARQFIQSVTTTLDYKWQYRWTTTLFRLEYRFNNSTGSQGGFYARGQVAPGVIGLTPSQNLLFFSILLSFDSP